MRKAVILGFGVLLLFMAFSQLLTFSFFYHTIRGYLLPMGAGVKLLELFVLPASLGMIGLQMFGGAGYVLVDKGNVLRGAMLKAGVAAMIIWSVLVFTALLRGMPLAYAGFFGGHLRQNLNWLIFIQSLVFIAWAYAARRLAETD